MLAKEEYVLLNRRSRALNFFPIRVTTSVAVKRLKLLVRLCDDDSTTIFTVVANLRNILCIHCCCFNWKISPFSR